MAWSDEPTSAQLAAIGNLIRWTVPSNIETLALDYLEITQTRREVSDEMKRLRELYINHKLSKDNVFSSPIWDGFNYKGVEK